MTPRRWALAFLASAAVVLAACSSPSTPKAATTTTTHKAATTTAPSSTTTSTTAPPTTTSTAASTACTHVTATAGQSQGAAGTITGVVTVTNTGPASCSVDGYPDDGPPLGERSAVDGHRGERAVGHAVPGGERGASRPSRWHPRPRAQFAYQFSDVPVGAETSCPTSETATVTMPGATAASPTFALAIDPCNNGTIRVSPVYAG